MRRLLIAVLLLVGSARAQTADARAVALAAERVHDLPAAEMAWQRVLAASPHDAEADAHLGLVYALQQRYEQAIPAYRRALLEHPHLPGVAMNLGLALFKSAHFPEALSAFEAAAAEAPGDPRPGLLLGMTHYGLGQYAEAVPFLRAGVAVQPTNLALRLTLAQSCLWAKDYGCALEEDRRILAQDPDSAQADMITGEALDAKGDAPGAIAQFRAAETVAPRTPSLHFGLGFLLWRDGQLEAAAPEFEQELALDPGHTQALTYKGDIAIKRSQWTQARAALEAAAAQANAIPLTWLDLGLVNAHDGRNADAEANYKRSIAMAPDDPEAHYRLARLQQATGRAAEARAELAIVQQLHKARNPGLLQQMGPPKPAQP